MKGRYFSTEEQLVLDSIIKSRRDVRGHRFLNKPIPNDVLKRILEAAISAPSVGYSQPWRFVLVREMKKKLAIKKIFEKSHAKESSSFKGDRGDLYHTLKLEGIIEAPVGIGVFCEDSVAPILGHTEMKETSAYSVVCAIQNLWLMARACNIGVGWVSLLDPLSVSKELGASQSHKFIAYLCLGYVDEFYKVPELESRGWEKKRDLDMCVYHESLS